MYIPHTMNLPLAVTVLNLAFIEDYALVCGVTPAGGTVLPSCVDTRYLVPCGIDGLPFVVELGREGGRFDFKFPEPVVAYVVVTGSGAMPVPQVATTPPPTIASIVEYSSDYSFFGYDLSNAGFTADPPYGDVSFRNYYFELTMSDGSIRAVSPVEKYLDRARKAQMPEYYRDHYTPTRLAITGPAVVGQTFAQTLAKGWKDADAAYIAY